ncbi:hypothetical protein BDB00DRAFT_868952 [Zychaea mexicana]|uniref:uncharacterized protein n=1 Tax=Zychaea mexicana TaxID=64656 RepID=UPI0022FECBA4|nr:uncharacterized protein BDB00DRAFT_868952 [Zychaea mexicana]KAI9497121.1 hypothetical protein BDB00DRAFT_868952 [Zychaea mexicana]
MVVSFRLDALSAGLDSRQSTVWKLTVWYSTLGIRRSAFDSRHSTLSDQLSGIRLSAFDSRQSTLGNQLPASVFDSQHRSIQ